MSNKERENLDIMLKGLISKHGAENALWTLARTLSVDKYNELLEDLCWAIGEDKG